MGKIIYSKYSNDRASQFKIRTDICVDETGEKYIQKSPLVQESEMHIEHILDVSHKLQEQYGEIAGINECRRGEGKEICFPYITGHTLDEELNIACQNSDRDGFLTLINRYKQFVEHGAVDRFEQTEEFTKIFGTVALPEDLKSVDVADIDLIFENVLIDGESWNIIDYEWTFLFPVPVNFIIYRALSAFAEGLYAKSQKNTFGLDLYDYCGIGVKEIIEYKKMIQGFERYVMQGGDTMKTLHGKISQKIYKPVANTIIYDKLNKMGIQVFPDFGDGFDEDKSYFVDADIDTFEHIKLEIDNEKGCCAYRIDPAMDCCVLELEEIKVDGEESKDFSTNGFVYGAKTVLFDTEDPQIYIRNVSGVKKILITAKLVLVEKTIGADINGYLSEKNNAIEDLNKQILDINKMAEEQNAKVADLYKRLEDLYLEKNEMEQTYVNQISQLTQNNQELQAQITDMTNTKVWRMYSKYLNIRNKNKA